VNMISINIAPQRDSSFPISVNCVISHVLIC
jgi:hypothetical protein